MNLTSVIRAGRARKKHTQELAGSAFEHAAKAWKQTRPMSIVDSWAVMSTAAVAAVMIAQRGALDASQTFLDQAFEEQSLDLPPARIRPESIVGTMPGTAAPLEAALSGVAFHTLDRIGADTSTPAAMDAGMLELANLVNTAVTDVSRAADEALIGAAPQRVGYVRMVSPGCCSRCAILAGQYYAWNSGFLRHPNCLCTHIPASEDVADDLTTDPYAAFNALSREEQDRIYTKAGAEAIRSGADMNQVVNSRRGMTTSGRFTREGSTRRGYYRITSDAGKAGKRRLSVDEIRRRSTGSKDRFVDLLTEYGYFV